MGKLNRNVADDVITFIEQKGFAANEQYEVKQVFMDFVCGVFFFFFAVDESFQCHLIVIHFSLEYRFPAIVIVIHY